MLEWSTWWSGQILTLNSGYRYKDMCGWKCLPAAVALRCIVQIESDIRHDTCSGSLWNNLEFFMSRILSVARLVAAQVVYLMRNLKV